MTKADYRFINQWIKKLKTITDQWWRNAKIEQSGRDPLVEGELPSRHTNNYG